MVGIPTMLESLGPPQGVQRRGPDLQPPFDYPFQGPDS